MHDADRWHVKISEIITEVMSLEQLVDGVRAGFIHANTYVIAPGESTWALLGDVADLSDLAPPLSAPLSQPTPYSFAPVVYDAMPSSSSYAGYPAPSYPASSYSTMPYPPASRSSLEPPPPRRSRFKSALFVSAAYLALVIVGAGAGAYKADPGQMKSTFSSLTGGTKASSQPNAMSAAATPPPAEVKLPAPTTPAPAPAPAPAPQAKDATPPSSVASLPAAAVSIDNLPTAKATASNKASRQKRKGR